MLLTVNSQAWNKTLKAKNRDSGYGNKIKIIALRPHRAESGTLMSLLGTPVGKSCLGALLQPSVCCISVCLHQDACSHPWSV